MPDRNGSSRPDIIELMQRGTEEGAQHYRDVVRTIRSEVVTRPLNPDARKLTRAEQSEHAARFLADKAMIAGQHDELVARFKLKDPQKPIPRRLAEYVLRAARIVPMAREEPNVPTEG